jgi:hypothetical protein
MIDPRHDCWWTGKRRTDLSIRAPWVCGGGVPLRVLLCAFLPRCQTWYSVVYGDLEDNVAVLATDDAVSATLERAPHSSPGPAATALQGIATVDEYRLTQGVEESLGTWPIQDSAQTPESYRHVTACVHVHDDCFFSVWPADDQLLPRLVESILQQHSYYLHTEVDWSPVISYLTTALRSGEELSLTSKPDARELHVAQDARRNLPWYRRFMGARSTRTIRINGARAMLV